MMIEKENASNAKGINTEENVEVADVLPSAINTCTNNITCSLLDNGPGAEFPIKRHLVMMNFMGDKVVVISICQHGRSNTKEKTVETVTKDVGTMNGLEDCVNITREDEVVDEEAAKKRRNCTVGRCHCSLIFHMAC
ncbi:hypothetical protein LIER_41103 [Lithospermum erythrorhizon]|uniref:Uncharacterized protein n=1 Tax=Lithospermum erythrorhizon TaxID=34254 RepID=A0AAV3R5M3_LITER